ncbi:hypothetical protein OG229_36000 [Streptomyces platensis]|uniref:hypothetical protein n=1 Tax=Streptomyces platensis TaxID=58346 RepID=UPI002E0DF452|nr:hypothetical protein OG229_36000 [Streptomyces platensis]
MQFRHTVAVLALLVLVTGCSSGVVPSRPRHSAPPPAVPPASKEVRRLVLPFDAYALSGPDVHTIESAEDVLIRGCMRAKGKEWTALPRPSAVDPDPPQRRRYGVIEPDVALRFGYHQPPAPPETARRDEIWRAREKMPRAAQLAAYGKDGVSGCWKKAHVRLLRDVPKSSTALFNRRIREEFTASQKERAVSSVVRSWSACMKRDGYRYPDPLAAAGDDRWAKSPRPSRHEIVVAQTDVRCKRETRLVSVWSKAETRLQHGAVRSHTTEFEKLAVQKAGWLKAARKVIHSGP